MVVTMTDTGYIKSQASAEYRAQKEAVRAEKLPRLKKEISSASPSLPRHNVLLCFTDKGRMFLAQRLGVLPEGSSTKATEIGRTRKLLAVVREDRPSWSCSTPPAVPNVEPTSLAPLMR